MQPSIVEVVAHASFLHGLLPTTAFGLDGNWWSLTPEVVFYCLLPFIVLKLPRLSQRLALLGACLVVAAATGTYVAVTGLHFVLPSGDPSPWLLTFPTTSLYVFVLGVVLQDVIARLDAALLGNPLLRPFLRSRALAFVGLISYSLFLLHGTVLAISSVRVKNRASALGGEGLLADWGGFLAFALAMFAVCGLLAYLSYRFVESPFLRRKPR